MSSDWGGASVSSDGGDRQGRRFRNLPGGEEGCSLIRDEVWTQMGALHVDTHPPSHRCYKGPFLRSTACASVKLRCSHTGASRAALGPRVRLFCVNCFHHCRLTVPFAQFRSSPESSWLFNSLTFPHKF